MRQAGAKVVLEKRAGVYATGERRSHRAPQMNDGAAVTSLGGVELRRDDPRRVIDTTDEDGRILLEETWAAVVSWNAREPGVFRTGTALTRVVTDSDGRAHMEQIKARGAIFPSLVTAARFVRRDRRTAEGRERESGCSTSGGAGVTCRREKDWHDAGRGMTKSSEVRR